MTELNCDLAVAQAIALIKSYSFDTNGNSAEKLVQQWLNNYQENWVRLAAIEALYLGRYKTVSIEQIMAVWLRIGTPNVHFKGEFERLICRKLPKHLVVANSFWFETEEYSVSNSLNECPNSTHLQDSRSSNLFTSESSSQAEPVTAANDLPHRLSDVKNILKQQTRACLLSDSSCFEPQPASLNSAEKQHQPEIQTPESYNLSYNSPTITNFHPIFDNSAFFHKLKSIACNLD